MRKVLLSLLFSCFGILAMGQNGLTPGRHYIPVNPDQIKATKATGDGQFTNWYDLIEDAKTTGFQTYNLFNGALFPDSTVQVLFGNGSGGTVLGYNQNQGTGELLDPTSQNYVTPLSSYNDYTIDSVALFYLYSFIPEGAPVKNPNAPDTLAHDTLIFQFYTVLSGGITESILAAQGTTFPQEFYGQVKYSPSTNLGLITAGPAYRYVLGVADTQSAIRGAIQVPVFNNANQPITVSRNNLKGYNTDAFAFTVSFRPGYKYKFGDTLVAPTEAYQGAIPKLPAHMHSKFRTLVGQTPSKVSNTDYEMSLDVVTAVRYNLPNYRGGSWPTGVYVGGSGWNIYNQVLWSAFHVTTPNLGVQNVADPKGYLLGEVYPNPAKGASRLDFTLGNTEIVTINVYDILGHKVATLANGMYTQGAHTINFDTNNLKEGVYLYSITAGSFTKTMKFSVTE